MKHFHSSPFFFLRNPVWRVRKKIVIRLPKIRNRRCICTPQPILRRRTVSFPFFQDLLRHAR